MKSTFKLIVRLVLYLVIYAFLLISIKSAYPQNLTPTAKGNFFNKDYEFPLEYSNIVVFEINPQTEMVRTV